VRPLERSEVLAGCGEDYIPDLDGTGKPLCSTARCAMLAWGMRGEAMPVRYRVTTRSRLNGDGVHGAGLFVGSPLVQAGGWTWYLSAPGWWPLGLIGVTSLTFLGGFVLLLIGRDYDSIIDETN